VSLHLIDKKICEKTGVRLCRIKAVMIFGYPRGEYPLLKESGKVLPGDFFSDTLKVGGYRGAILINRGGVALKNIKEEIIACQVAEHMKEKCSFVIDGARKNLAD